VLVPGADRAQVAIEKVRDYCLSQEHPRGRHKARVLESALGLRQEHAAQLRDSLLFAVKTYDAVLGDLDTFGQRYTVNFPMEGPNGTALIQSGWIVRRGEDFPRFVTCFVV
jgi:hypothetical protein